MHGLWLLPNNVVCMGHGRTILISSNACPCLCPSFIHPHPSSKEENYVVAKALLQGSMKCYIIFFSIWKLPQCEVRPPHPLYIQSPHTTSSYSSFPTYSSTDGAAISMEGQRCNVVRWQLSVSKEEDMGDGTWPYDMGPIIPHPEFSQLSIHPSSNRVPLDKGLYMEHVWIRTWASPTFQHTRSHKVHIQMRLTSKTSHPSSGWKPLQVGSYKKVTSHICLCWVLPYRRRLFVLT